MLASLFNSTDCAVVDNVSQWLTSGPLIQKKIISENNKEKVFEITVFENKEESKWNYIYRDIPVKEEQFVSATANMRLLWKKESIGAGLTLSFIDKEGKRLEYIEERLTESTTQFVPIKLYAKTPINTKNIRVSIYIHNEGKIESTIPNISCSLRNEDDNTENVIITINQQPQKQPLIGFGVEDDGRFYDINNRNSGVDEEAIKIRVNRLKDLRPHWVRTFVWFKDWNPSDDGKTFTFESDGIKSLCKTLEDYKNLHTDVNITCVDWGMKDTWEDKKKRVNTIIELLNYLIKKEKYNNLKYFTLTNEPNYFFETKENRFKRFIELQKMLKEEFVRNGLNLKIIGSDDAMGTDWFSACVNDKEYSNIVDIWASHFYWHHSTSYFSNELFKNRKELLKRKSINKNKPFVVTEFGIVDKRFQPPSINPIMQEYKGALYTVASIIDGLNQGVTGFSIWCLQEVRYPGLGEPMRIGLWGYADKNWQLFPIFDGVKIFTNNTYPNDKIYYAISSKPIYVKFAKVGKTYFWANLSKKEQNITICDKINCKHLYKYTNDNNKDILIYKKIKINKNEILLPPESFGYIK